MKLLLTPLLVLVNLVALGQQHDWTVSFSSGFALGGPAASIKNQMKKQGFDQGSQYNFFGFSGSSTYPVISQDASLLLRVTKKISEKRSLFFVGGLASGGQVTGFKNQGYVDLILLGSSYGPMPSVKFSIWQLGGGILFTPEHIRSKFGLGPSIYIVNHAWNEGEKHNSVVPGLTGTARFPLGKEKRAIGIEWMIDLNMAPSVNFGSDGDSGTDFHPGKAAMFSAGTGLAITWRKHGAKNR